MAGNFTCTNDISSPATPGTFISFTLDGTGAANAGVCVTFSVDDNSAGGSTNQNFVPVGDQEGNCSQVETIVYTVPDLPHDTVINFSITVADDGVGTDGDLFPSVTVSNPVNRRGSAFMEFF